MNEVYSTPELMAMKHFVDWESAVLGRGYGSGEEFVFPALRTFFENVSHGQTGNCYDYRDLEKALGGPTTWLLINVLCHADVIDYGSSPRHGWLSTEGQALKKFFLSHTLEELYGIYQKGKDFNQERGWECFPDLCQCARYGEPCNNPFFEQRWVVDVAAVDMPDQSLIAWAADKDPKWRVAAIREFRRRRTGA